MKKIINLQDLDCANCAAKMEDNIRKIDGVKNVSVNFMTQKMVLECDDNRCVDILRQVKNVCRKVEPDCKLMI